MDLTLHGSNRPIKLVNINEILLVLNVRAKGAGPYFCSEIQVFAIGPEK